MSHMRMNDVHILEFSEEREEIWIQIKELFRPIIAKGFNHS